MSLVTMTHEELPGVEKIVEELAYRYAWFPEGWRSEDDPDWEGSGSLPTPPTHAANHELHNPFEGTVDLFTEDVTVNPGPVRLLNIGATSEITLDNAISAFYHGVILNPTIVYSAPSVFSGGRSFDEEVILKNPSGVAKTMPHNTGFYAAATLRGDGALFTTSRSTFLDPGVYDVINGGTVAAAHEASFDSAMAVGAGVTVNPRRGLRFADAVGAGAVTLQIGVDIAALAKGATNIGIRNASTLVGTPLVQALTAVGNTITPTALVKRLNNTSGGSLTLTSNPLISDGQDGQILILFNSSANDVVLTDGQGVQLGAATRTLGARDTLMLIYSADIGDWIELAFTNN